MPPIPDVLIASFETAGWTSERGLYDTEIGQSHPAFEILRSFQGLHLGLGNHGEMADDVANDIRFREIASRDKVIGKWSRLLDSELIGFADYHHDHGELYISQDGRVFCRSLMHDAFGYQADSFFEAIDGLLKGQRSLPMLRPDQKTVSWYGQTYRKGDSGLYPEQNFQQ